MRGTLGRYGCFCVGLAVTMLASSYVQSAPPQDWTKIPVKTIALFYPGQASNAWTRSSKHMGFDWVRRGARCRTCHEGEEEAMGKLLVSGGELEPAPIPGKSGFKNVSVQTAYDSENLYFRFQWRSDMNREGRMHNMVRFDGTDWQWLGGHRADPKVRTGKTPPLYEDRFSIIVDDGSVPGFAEQGCWLTCHDSMRHMPDAPKADAVKAHPYLGKTMKKKDIRKYIPLSRISDDNRWDKVKSPDDIAIIKAAGGFLDLMQWRVARSNPVGMADDGYVLQYRNFDAGKKMFSWNLDRKTMTPKYMFDADKTGYIALREEDFANPAKATAIVKEVNARPYDPNAGFKVGDILPGRLLTTNTKGSAGDNNPATGTWKDKTYTLFFTRRLDTGHPEDDKILKPGGVYSISFAIHDDNVTTRFHQVSFPFTLGIGVRADLQAVKVD